MKKNLYILRKTTKCSIIIYSSDFNKPEFRFTSLYIDIVQQNRVITVSKQYIMPKKLQF